MHTCRPDGSMPKYCAEAFNAVSQQLGRMSGKLDAIHDQAAGINGHVARLSERTGRHGQDISALQENVKDLQRSRSTWSGRLWRLGVGVGLFLAGYLLKG